MQNAITPLRPGQIFPEPVDERHPLRSAAFMATMRVTLARRLAEHYVECSLPDVVLDNISNYIMLINDQQTPNQTTKFATNIFKAYEDQSAMEALWYEKYEVKYEVKIKARREEAESKWEKKWQSLLKKYGKTIDRENKPMRDAISKALTKTKPGNRHYENILIDKICEKDQLLSTRLKAKTHDPQTRDKIRQEDITPLTKIAARRYAKMKREAAKPHLHKALEAAEKSHLITVIDLSASAFIIHDKRFKQLATDAGPALYIEVVSLINWLLLEDVDQAQALWNAVILNSDFKSDAFNSAKKELGKCLENCEAYNSLRWKGDPKLNEEFCIKWAKFALDSESSESSKLSKTPRSPRVLGGVKKFASGIKFRLKKE